MMKEYSLSTGRNNEMVDITSRIRTGIAESGVQDGIAVIFVPHTTAAVTINENADPDVKSDMLMGMETVAPDSSRFRHAEGNSAAHIKTTLTGPSLTVIISGGRPLLGTWQGIYFCEYDGPRSRKFMLKVMQG
ncbi:MAG: hypothetical protein CVV64_04990 [Candidatus Wallbacteria bacterium HGW-Wallbacteria-1]|uniref:Secondary thiamine-phosphate synthase enzyme n=1 Tax=Candidatus Wallbacteria bacterium HGW-Wallbacteria-1 TaxID=2013854 RepID=A0A2N1PS16_9BACT|nr:MAG: hypothetical protein CVV64_04990 [Candidatus Wallbacteria bacterium HGW-Wallbacteria-1]